MQITYNSINLILFMIILILVVSLLIIWIRKLWGANTTIDINAEALVTVKNDMIRYSLTVESKTGPTSDGVYNDILPTVEQIKQLLEKTPGIINLSISFSTDPVYEYQPQTKLTGYKATASIKYDGMLDSEDVHNEILKEYSSLQNVLISMSKDTATVLLNSMNYTVSDSIKRKYESTLTKNVIDIAKKKADDMIMATFGYRKDYEIVDMNVNFGNNVSMPMLMRSAAPTNVLSEGETTLSANAMMKILVK